MYLLSAQIDPGEREKKVSCVCYEAGCRNTLGQKGSWLLQSAGLFFSISSWKNSSVRPAWCLMLLEMTDCEGLLRAFFFPPPLYRSRQEQQEVERGVQEPGGARGLREPCHSFTFTHDRSEQCDIKEPNSV